MEEGERGSFAAFIIGLIGGLIWVLGGLALLGYTIMQVWGVRFSGSDSVRNLAIKGIAVAFFIVITNTWVVYSATWMRERKTLKTGGWTMFAFSIISLNLIAYISSMIGLIQWSYWAGGVSREKSSEKEKKDLMVQPKIVSKNLYKPNLDKDE